MKKNFRVQISWRNRSYSYEYFDTAWDAGKYRPIAKRSRLGFEMKIPKATKVQECKDGEWVDHG